jgi:hypothetical protein
MGYNVHITRKQDWFDEEPQISATEWDAYIRLDPSMRLDGYAEATTAGGDTLRYENEGLAVWIGYSHHEPDGNMAWFDFRSGDVVVKNPDSEILKKMWLIAQALGGKVQGDESETYGEDGSVIER